MHVILSFIPSAMPWGIAQQSYLELSRRISKSGRGEKSDGEGVIRSRRWLTERSKNDRFDSARGNRAGPQDLAVDRDDFLAEPQFTGWGAVVPSDAPERMLGRHAQAQFAPRRDRRTPREPSRPSKTKGRGTLVEFSFMRSISAERRKTPGRKWWRHGDV